MVGVGFTQVSAHPAGAYNGFFMTHDVFRFSNFRWRGVGGHVGLSVGSSAPPRPGSIGICQNASHRPAIRTLVGILPSKGSAGVR